MENDVPIGLVTRTHFYQKLGSLYGYNLYIGRSIELLMNKNILVVDYTTSIIEVSRMAMKRKEEELYDYVIITKYGLYAGVVSISRLLIKFAELQSHIARYLNPLTFLPGNLLIEEQLKEIVSKEKFSVLYIDLDYFKTYNDLYGFAKGDQVIKATASILQDSIREANGFLGHIGGDDFLAILYHHDYHSCCNKIIHKFNQMVPSIYSEKHLLQKFVYAEDRFGVKQRIPLLSISIAIVTNQDRTYLDAEEIVLHATAMKKKCKLMIGSCYVDSVCNL